MRQMLRVALRLVSFDLRRYLIGGLLWLPVSLMPLITGLLLKLLFDQISDGQAVDLHNAWWLCAALVAVELARGAIMVVAWTYGVYWWDAAATVLRGNLLRSLLTARGPASQRLPSTSGESLARLRADVGALVDFADEFVALAGAFFFAVGAYFVMIRIDRVIAVVLVVPMLVVAVLSAWVSRAVKRIHSDSQVKGAKVTEFIGEIFTNLLSIKTAGAEDAALTRLRRFNLARRDAAVRDRLATDLLNATTGASVELGIGLVLLLGTSSMRRGEFTVGDLALMTSYVSWLTGLPRSVGSLLFRAPQAAVALERLRRLLAPHESEQDLVRDTEVWFSTPAPDTIAAAARVDPMQCLEGRGLTVRWNGGGRGIQGVDLRVPRGSFTVLTGAVGSGKTTVVRALLGLVAAQRGEVLWNGRPIADPATELGPTRTGYASQTPRVFSGSLRENLLLGWTDKQLGQSLHLAILNEEVDEMPDGLDTLVGSRGVRLSGGQLQRATAARAIVRTQGLLVLDDLSSALDVETEAQLWDRLAGAVGTGDGPDALLVVSHRRAALRRADQVIVLDNGQVVGCGQLDDLLRDCAEMRRLWREEIDDIDNH